MSDTAAPPLQGEIESLASSELTIPQVLATCNGGDDVKEMNEAVREIVSTLENLHITRAFARARPR